MFVVRADCTRSPQKPHSCLFTLRRAAAFSAKLWARLRAPWSRFGGVPFVMTVRAIPCGGLEQAARLLLGAGPQRHFAAVEIGLADMVLLYRGSGLLAAASTAAGVICPRNIRTTGAGHTFMSNCADICDSRLSVAGPQQRSNDKEQATSRC